MNTKTRYDPSWLLIEELSPCLWRFVGFQMIIIKRDKVEWQGEAANYQHP